MAAHHTRTSDVYDMVMESARAITSRGRLGCCCCPALPLALHSTRRMLR